MKPMNIAIQDAPNTENPHNKSIFNILSTGYNIFKGPICKKQNKIDLITLIRNDMVANSYQNQNKAQHLNNSTYLINTIMPANNTITNYARNTNKPWLVIVNIYIRPKTTSNELEILLEC